MHNYASHANPMHYCALLWPTMTYRALSSALTCITVHVPVCMGDQNIDLRHWDNLSSLWHCACSASKLEISEFELDWFLQFKFESFEATCSITVPFQSIRQGLWHVMGLLKIWFQQPSKVVVTYPNFWEIFGSLAPQATRKFLYYSHDYQMNSAHHKNCHDNHDISAFWRVPWCVTAELNEMVQYFKA